ncbi:hypothetical protein Tco_1177199, partial [Tanacetum coccineum]
GPEHPPLPDYVPGPEYPEYLIPSDDEAPIEDQPLPSDASPTALSPGYVADSDPEEDPEEDPADYPADRGDKEEESSGDDANDEDEEESFGDDTDDEDEEESSGDDADDEDEEEASKDEDKEEEEHITPADSTTLPAVDPVPLAKDIEAFETDESAPTPHALITAVAAALPSSSPPASPLSPWSSPLPQIPSLPLPWRATSPSTHHSSEITSPPMLLPSTTHRDDLLEADMPLQKRARFIAPTGRFKVGESSSVADRQAGHTLAYRVDYGFIDTVDASICTSESKAITAVGEVNERVTDLATTHRQETHELQMHCEDAQDDRALLRA